MKKYFLLIFLLWLNSCGKPTTWVEFKDYSKNIKERVNQISKLTKTSAETNFSTALYEFDLKSFFGINESGYRLTLSLSPETNDILEIKFGDYGDLELKCKKIGEVKLEAALRLYSQDDYEEETITGEYTHSCAGVYKKPATLYDNE